MDFDLHRIGSREFEHLAQALMRRIVGPSFRTYGDGTDGGREGTWVAKVDGLGLKSIWDGQGVLQAKHRTHRADTADNLTWLKGEIAKEVAAWADPGKRSAFPEYFVVATNVRLSAVPGAGKDAADEYLRERLHSKGLAFTDVRIWDYDDIRHELAQAASIRQTYAGLLTPGDVIQALIDDQEQGLENFRRALLSHAARTLVDSNTLNLVEAGDAADDAVTTATAFTDLPLETQKPDWKSETGEVFSVVDNSQRVLPFLLQRADRTAEGLVADNLARRVVLLGGPGQGKSTVTKYLTLAYQAEMLRHTELASERAIRECVESIDASYARLDVNAPKNRRWPIRIVMTTLADHLANKKSESVIHFISQEVSDRSTYQVTPEQMLTWLSRCPWLLLIDGLDEVPDSTNRTEVLRAIQDFYYEAATHGGDVVTVATTRHQGYKDEFRDKDFEHASLVALDGASAVAFATSFINLRAQPGSTRARELLKAFQDASQHPGVGRLLGSPLQVSIMVVLLERGGRAPRDRWRLFSQYYNVILQREQQKPGELAELLGMYQADIEAIHRAAGYMLHERSGQSGGTDSTLSRAELRDLILTRLLAQGHEDEDASALTERFLFLMTDRLVFLTANSADTINFEVRSLQEFMAAEHIVVDTSEDVSSRLTRLSLLTHWRVVTLFAIGKIFAQQESLRAAVVAMCAELDETSGTFGSPKLGSELALDIMNDGVCETSPRFGRLFAASVIRLLELPAFTFCRQIAALCLNDARMAQVAESHVITVSREDPTALQNWLALLGMIRDDLPWAAQAQEQLRQDLSPKVVRGLASSAPRSAASMWITRPVLERARELDIDLLLLAAERFGEGAAPNLKAVGADDLEAALLRLLSANRRLSANTRLELCDLDAVVLSLAPLRSHPELWAKLVDPTEGTTDPRWLALSCIATFNSDPSASSLSAAIRAFPRAGAQVLRFAVLASDWVLAAVVQYYISSLRIAGLRPDSEQARHIAVEMADAALAGDLGDFEGWTNLESRFAESPAGSQILKLKLELAGDNPSTRFAGADELWLLAISWLVTRPSERADSVALMEAVDELLASISSLNDSKISGLLREQAAWALSSVLLDPNATDQERRLEQRDFDALSQKLHAELIRPRGRRNNHWLSSLAWDRLLELYAIDEIDAYGRSALSFRTHDSELAENLTTQWKAEPSRWGLLRLALQLDGSTAWRRDVLDASEQSTDVPTSISIVPTILHASDHAEVHAWARDLYLELDEERSGLPSAAVELLGNALEAQTSPDVAERIFALAAAVGRHSPEDSRKLYQFALRCVSSDLTS